MKKTPFVYVEPAVDKPGWTAKEVRTPMSRKLLRTLAPRRERDWRAGGALERRKQRELQRQFRLRGWEAIKDRIFGTMAKARAAKPLQPQVPIRSSRFERVKDWLKQRWGAKKT